MTDDDEPSLADDAHLWKRTFDLADQVAATITPEDTERAIEGIIARFREGDGDEHTCPDVLDPVDRAARAMFFESWNVEAAHARGEWPSVEPLARLAMTYYEELQKHLDMERKRRAP